MSSGGYDAPHIPARSSRYIPRQPSGSISASYERPSSPIAVPARRYSYDRSTYPPEYSNVYRPNAPNVYRPEYNAYYRSPSPERYPPSHAMETDDWDAVGSSWRSPPPPPSASWSDRRPAPPISPTAPSPKERVYEREDKRMFEPSNAWKQTHVDRPRIDRSEITPTDLYSGYRNHASPNNPDDVIAADRPLYRPGTERYRPNSKWEPYTTLARSHYNPYKPNYDPAGSSWPPYTNEPGSPPAASYRRDSTAVRTSDHYENPYASGSVPGSVSPRPWRSPPSKRMRLARSPSRDLPYYGEHSSIELYRNSYDPDVSRKHKARRRSSSLSSIASTNHSENRASNPPFSSQYPEPTLADLGPLGKVTPNDAIANQPILVEAMKSAKSIERPTATPVVIKVEDAAKALPERPKFPQGLPAKPVAAIQAANGGIVNGSTVNRSRSASNAQPTPPRQPKSWPSPPPTTKPLAPAPAASFATPVPSPSAAPPAPKVPTMTTASPSKTPATTGVLPTPPISRVQMEEIDPPVAKVAPDAMRVDEPAPASIKTPTSASPPANIKKPAAELPTPAPAPPPETACPTPAVPPPQPTLETLKPMQPIQGSISESLRITIRTRMLRDHQKRDDRVEPILLVNRRLAPKSETQSTTTPQEVVNKMTSGTPMEVRMKSFSALKPSLVEYFQERQTEITEKVQKLKEEYLSLHERWRTQCASLNEKSRVRNAEAEVAHHMGRTTRRAAALGDAVRSDLEMEQIIASLGYDEATDAHHLSMRNVATIPDMISVTRGKVEYLFDDTSRRVDHPHEYYAPDTGIEDWTQQEREIFIDKYAAFPKQFGIIADYLPHKTAAQCVAFYYLHKKRHINFRQVVAMLAPNKRRRRGTGKKKGNALLADIAQHDAQVLRDAGAGSPASGRLTRGRKPVSSRVSAVLQAGATPTATPTPEPDAKPVKRRGRPPGTTNAAIAAAAAAAAAAELAASTVASTAPASRTVSVSREEPEPEIEDSQTRPKRAKRTRQVKSAAIVPEEADNPTPEPESEQPESISAHGRKPQPSVTQWSEEDKKLFLLLLAQHGANFKRIAASMPNKTTVQVNNYYKANEEELNLKEVVTGAPKRSLSPSPITEKPPPSSSASQVPPPPTTAISNSTLPDTAPPMGALLPDSPQRKIAPVPPSSAPVASSSHSTMSDKSSRGPATKSVPPPTAPAALRAPSKFPARQRTPPTAPASFLSRNGSNAPSSEPYVYKPPSHFMPSTHYRTGTSPPTRPTYQPSSTTSRPYVYPTHYVPHPRVPPGASHSHAHSPYTYGHPTTMPTANNTQGHYPAYTPNSASRNALPPRNANGRHEPYAYNPGLPHPYYYP